MKNILTQLFGDAVTDDVLTQFNKELGVRYVLKADFNEKLNEISTLKTEKKELTDKIEDLGKEAADAKDFKKQLEDLQQEIAEKEKQDKADREAKERADSIASRFDAVIGEKKFTHDAIKADYLKKFGEALDSKEFEGKSDSEIIHALTKDDGAAFENVTAFRLEGGANKDFGADISDAQVRAVMGLPPTK